MGMRINVCRAFHMRSKAGILSAKNSSPNSASETPMIHHDCKTSRLEGREMTPKRPSSPSVATVAYTLSPAAKLVAASMAAVWSELKVTTLGCGDVAGDSVVEQHLGK